MGGASFAGAPQLSRWLPDATALTAIMRQVICLAGPTQIERVLRHVRAEHQQQPGAAALRSTGEPGKASPIRGGGRIAKHCEAHAQARAGEDRVGENELFGAGRHGQMAARHIGF
jgi:hypothetical protein